jgi:putative ABC transport system substrate-binding protein
MRRREFITILGGAAAWPIAARGQQAPMATIGFVSGGSALEFAPYVAAFNLGLRESGFVEGINVAVEYRWAEGKYERLSALTTDLVRRHVAVITGVNSTAGVLVAKGATETIPIVFVIGGDPLLALADQVIE